MKHSWIFLRGLARHQGNWGPFLDFFRKQFPNDEVELLDLAGNGTESDRSSYLNISDYAQDLKQRSKLIQDGKKPIVVALSLGAMTAVEMARLYPNELGSIILVNTSDSGTSFFYERFHPRNYSTVLKTLFSNPGNYAREQFILKLTALEVKNTEELLEQFSKYPQTTRSNFVRQMLAASRYTFPHKKPIDNVFIISAKGDALVNSICSKRIASKWKVKNIRHPKGSHDLTLSEPAWVVEQLKNITDSLGL